MENLGEKQEKKELPFEADLRVDFIRHGKPNYKLHEEGALDPDTQSLVRKEAETFVSNIKPGEVIWIWKSPRNRAQETAKIYAEVLEQNGIKVEKNKTQPQATDASLIEFANLGKSHTDKKFLSLSPFDYPPPNDYLTPANTGNTPLIPDNDYTSNMSALDYTYPLALSNTGHTYKKKTPKYPKLERPKTPEKVVGTNPVKIRVLMMMQMFDTLARKNPIAADKKLHIIVFGHEELFDDILDAGSEPGFLGGPTYGERMQMDMFKGEKPTDGLKVKIQYRDYEGEFIYTNKSADSNNRKMAHVFEEGHQNIDFRINDSEPKEVAKLARELLIEVNTFDDEMYSLNLPDIALKRKDAPEFNPVTFIALVKKVLAFQKKANFAALEERLYQWRKQEIARAEALFSGSKNSIQLRSIMMNTQRILESAISTLYTAEDNLKYLIRIIKVIMKDYLPQYNTAEDLETVE